MILRQISFSHSVSQTTRAKVVNVWHVLLQFTILLICFTLILTGENARVMIYVMGTLNVLRQQR